MKGLLISILLFALFFGLVLADALAVGSRIAEIEEGLSSVTANADSLAYVEHSKQILENDHFLFSISLPLFHLEELESKLLALELAVQKGAPLDTEKEKEALALCLKRIKRTVLPTLAELL